MKSEKFLLQQETRDIHARRLRATIISLKEQQNVQCRMYNLYFKSMYTPFVIFLSRSPGKERQQDNQSEQHICDVFKKKSAFH